MNDSCFKEDALNTAMIDIKITFTLPAKVIAELIVRRRTRQREYKLLLIGGAVGMASLWFLTFASHWKIDMLFSALIITSLTCSIPLGLRSGAMRIAMSLPGVATEQSWQFNIAGIVVTNTDGTTIHSPWSIVKEIEMDEEYCYLVVVDGGRAPIPLNLLKPEGVKQLREMHSVASENGV